MTTLGRGGSDTTAVAFAAAFGAERCVQLDDRGLCRLFGDLIVLSLTAAPEVLADRLAARGREDAADRARRP